MDYPLVVLKRQLRRASYSPKIVDNLKNEITPINKIEKPKIPVVKKLPMLISPLIAAAAIHLTVVSPMTETSAANEEMESLIQQVELTDAEVINNLTTEYEVITEITDGYLTSLTIKGDYSQLHEATVLAMKISTLKEVMADGQYLQVKYTSGE